MSTDRIERIHIETLSTTNFTAPTNSVGDAAIVNTDTKVQAKKLEHVHRASTDFGLAIGGTVAAVERAVYVATAVAETIRAFKAKLNGAQTAGTVSFDLKKNGSTILTGTVDFDSGDAATLVQAGTLSSTALAAGDVLSIAMTVTTGSDGTGPLAWVDVDAKADGA